jgi:hypothetical protein
MPAVLLTVYTDWECPACGCSERTPPLPPNASRFHSCPRLHMLTAPLVRAGTDCTVTATERGDYLGGDAGAVTLGDDGRPYMNVETRYADGRNDCAVFAPVARIRLRAG